MGMLDWLFKKKKKKWQDLVVFYATSPDSLNERMTDLVNAMKNLPVLKEESLARFRSNISDRLTCKTVSLVEVPEFLLNLILYQSRHLAAAPGVSRLDVECTYLNDFDRGEKMVLDLPLFRFFSNRQADFSPHIIGRVDDDQFEIWYMPDYT